MNDELNFSYVGELKYLMGETPFETGKFVYNLDDSVFAYYGYPANDYIIIEVLKNSNFIPSKKMAKDILMLAFDGGNSDSPGGDQFECYLGRYPTLKIVTVGPEGALWQLKIIVMLNNNYKVKLVRKTKPGKYPELMISG